MNNCLLCNQIIVKKIQFSAIFSLQKQEQAICNHCTMQFTEIDFKNSCQRCCKRSTEKICKDCSYWQSKGEIVDHHALYHYDEQMEDYFSHYKFQGDYLLRTIFSKKIKEALQAYKEYVVVPIPISQTRYEERGFNQVIGLLEGAGVPYETFLSKEHTKKQSSLTRKERLNTKQSFYLSPSEKNLPEKILLVDDIYTTGATIRMAKAILMKNGVKFVKTFSLAR
ncbi:ComF family protein [Streptococcus cameli]